MNRLKRRLKNVKKHFDLITEENDLYRGAIYSSVKPGFDYKKRLDEVKGDRKKLESYISNLESVKTFLVNTYSIPKNLIEIDRERLRILTSVEIVEELKDEIKKKGFSPALVTEIPAYDLPILQLEWV